MSIPSVAHVFESGINAAPTNSMGSNSLEALVRHQLAVASRELATTSEGPAAPQRSKNLIGDMGEYLAQTAQMWCCLTDKLVQGPHVAAVVEAAHEEAHAKHHTSDLGDLVAMDLEVTKLNKLRDLTEKFSRDVLEVWQRRNEPGSVVSAPTYQTASFPIKPEPGVLKRRPSVTGNDVDFRVPSDTRMLPTSQIADGHPSPAANASASDDSEEDEDEQFAEIDMEALKQRGKGSYNCPLGLRCDKGGVDKDGNLVLFDRNSSFAYACRLVVQDIGHLLTPVTGNTATNTVNHGGAMFPDAQIHQRNASLRAEMDSKDTKRLSSIVS
ncbi:hypothetical protein FZEAL_10580 [Fusarium zealandicum]|uniref:Uncharacterized protein n=1 Tax=Fusarium zealandicum TaxID=1053134 RepID=A0A8H4X9L1_9HYPO|nr:hypothetical protein FZEAL_10580 [Fusarium zealandicum]